MPKANARTMPTQSFRCTILKIIDRSVNTRRTYTDQRRTRYIGKSGLYTQRYERFIAIPPWLGRNYFVFFLTIADSSTSTRHPFGFGPIRRAPPTPSQRLARAMSTLRFPRPAARDVNPAWRAPAWRPDGPSTCAATRVPSATWRQPNPKPARPPHAPWRMRH
jgi:hypothetical protein